MKLINKILSHGLLIAFFVAVFFLYLYRVDLFPQWFGEEAVDMQAHSGSAQTAAGKRESPGGGSPPSQGGQPQQPSAAADVAQAAPQSETRVTPPQQTASATAVQPVPQASTQPPVGAADLPPMADSIEPAPAARGPAQQPTAAATQPPPAQLPPQVSAAPPNYRPTTGEQPGHPVTAWQQPPQQSRAQTFPSQPERREPPPLPEQAPGQQMPPMAAPAPARQAPPAAAATAQPGDDYQAQLDRARQFFWEQDLGNAASAYQQLTAAYPQRADAWGELGNLYFNNGRWQAAADAYYRAIALLIEQREPQRAQHMLRVMYGLDSGKASELEQRLKQTGG